MKEENEVYKEYIKYNPNKPLLFGKEEHWKTYYEGYEMGYRDAAEESLNSLVKTVGMNLKKFPTNVDEQFDVMKKALQKYYEENGSDTHIPTYTEMLEMSADEFKKWIVFRVENPHRDQLLKEMIVHEESTGSFKNSARKEITPAEQVVLDVFNPAKSVEIVSLLGRMKDILGENEEPSDLVQDAILAKAASDHVGLDIK